MDPEEITVGTEGGPRGAEGPPIAGGSDRREAARRPTPLDPYPEPREEEEEGGGERAYPPELGTDAIAILEGRTFMYSDPLGDVPPGSIGGLLHDDTRFLSGWTLTLNGERPSLLKSGVVDHYSAAFFLTNPDLPGIRANTLTIRRFRFVGGGLHEQIIVFNSATRPLRVQLRLDVAADFADLFEVKSAVRDRGAWIDTEHDPEESFLHFHYEVPGFLAETNVRALESGIAEGVNPATALEVPLAREHRPRIDGDAIVWEAELPSRSALVIVLRTTVRVNERALEPIHEAFGEEQERAEGALTSWLDEVPRFSSDHAVLKAVFDKSVVDLAALRIAGEVQGEPYVLPAAGLPWFMTLFGRDTLITSLQTIWVGPELARGALHLLGELQGTKVDPFRDEEPGKILHEVRFGELTVTGEKPHSPYYGTADATPLYLVLMSEYWRYTGDDDFVREHWDTVLSALRWIDEHGDRDGDGYVEYQTRSSQGSATSAGRTRGTGSSTPTGGSRSCRSPRRRSRGTCTTRSAGWPSSRSG